MVPEYKDLPTKQDYHYVPRAGDPDARNPPLSPHLFDALFDSCPVPCSRIFFPHDCISPPTGAVNLNRIPKRTKAFENDHTSPIWGLRTVFAVSFAWVAAYHFIMVVAPFVFFGMWLRAHPGDYQNAAVPITVILGALSLFWSGAGILTGGRE
jgi:hypothetical protein